MQPRRAKWRDHGLVWYLAVVVVPTAIIAFNYVLHGKTFTFADIGSDTFFSFYPTQVGVARLMHAFDFSGWSFQFGLGSFVGNLFDPAWLVTGWLPLDWQLASRLPTFLAKTLLAGGFMFAYLREVGFEKRIAALGALYYAFCDYALINGSWEVVHGVQLVQFSAWIFLLERYLRGGSRWSAIAAGVVVGLGNAFGLYEFSLVSVLYLVVRFATVQPQPFRDAVATTARFVGWCIVGLALTAPLLLPAAWHFLDSPRVSGSHSFLPTLIRQIFTLNGLPVISAEVGGILGKNLFGIGNAYHGWTNYLEGPSFYVGLLPLLCVPQLASRRASRGERRLFWTAAIGITAYILFPALRYAAFAFGHVAFRISTLWISALILVAGLAGLRRALRSGLSLPLLVAGVAAIIAIALGITHFDPGAVNRPYARNVIVLALAFATLLVIGGRDRDPWQRGLLFVALIVLSIAELSVQSLPSVTHRINVLADGNSVIGSYHNGEDVVAGILRRDTSGRFFRIMKTRPSVYMDDSMIQGYAGTSSYYFHDRAITRFIDRMKVPRPLPAPNYIGPPTCCHALANLLAVDYVMTPAGQAPPWSGLALITRADGWMVYRNPEALPFGFFASGLVSEAAADKQTPKARHALTRTNAIVAAPALVKQRLAALDKAAGTARVAEATATIKVVGNSHVRGALETPRAQLLVLAMPLDYGWRARIDGKPAPLIEVDYGLTGIAVPPGHHQLTMRYLVQGRVAGLWLALLALLGAVFGPRIAATWRTRAERRDSTVRP